MIILWQDNMLYYNGFYFHYNIFSFFSGYDLVVMEECVEEKTTIHIFGALLICMNISVWSSASMLKGMG